MKTLKDAIELIMAQPPEPRYPAYFADLLSEADATDIHVGDNSETPNSSETIYRQAAIDAVKEFRHGATEWRDEQEERSNIWHRADSAIASAIEIGLRIKKLPSAQPEIIRCKDCKYAEVADKEDAQDGYTCQFHRGSIWFSGSFCSWAERRTDEQ